MRKHLKIAAQLILALWISGAVAGSFDDFFVAIKRDNPRPIVELLQRGFDPNTIGADGNHGLFVAVREGDLKAAEALIDWPQTKVEWRSAKDESPLMIAALKGYTDIARKLIIRGADVNKPGWTPLHYSATGGHVDIMRMLLDESAYIDAESPNKTTPLMMAAQYGSREAVKLLLDEGADPTLKNELGLTAADFARRVDRQDVAETITAAIRARAPAGKW